MVSRRTRSAVACFRFRRTFLPTRGDEDDTHENAEHTTCRASSHHPSGVGATAHPRSEYPKSAPTARPGCEGRNRRREHCGRRSRVHQTCCRTAAARSDTAAAGRCRRGGGGGPATDSDCIGAHIHVGGPNMEVSVSFLPVTEGRGVGKGKGGAGRRRGHQAATRPGSRRRQLVHPHHAGDAPGYEPASRLGGLWRPGRGGAGRGDVRAVQEAAVINGAYPANRHAEGQPDVVASLYDRDALPETDPPTQDA